MCRTFLKMWSFQFISENNYLHTKHRYQHVDADVMHMTRVYMYLYVICLCVCLYARTCTVMRHIHTIRSQQDFKPANTVCTSQKDHKI
jgi:hypothetical protein